MAKSKDALGKGIDALLAEVDVSVEDVTSPASITKKAEKNEALPKGLSQENGELYVELSLLKPNPQQPRLEFDHSALEELSNSIKEHGVIQPVLIEQGDKGIFYIIAGERRCRAAKLAGLEKVPCRMKNFSQERKLEVALIENIQRENLNPIEEAIAYKRLMELSNISQGEVATRVGKNRTTVTNSLRLLKLPEDMQNALANGSITSGHARAILSVINPADQRVLFGRIIGSQLSVRETEEFATKMNSGNRTEKAAQKVAALKDAPKKDADLYALEQQFIEALGTKVSIKGSFDKGYLQVEYYSRDDLDRLYEVFINK
ncbi:MAG: ParB/RepB/Spo0J family partition protein [Treponema sp.]|nr:ParB/RepB/Spo0J family partition protein [Treponema sp.]